MVFDGSFIVCWMQSLVSLDGSFSFPVQEFEVSGESWACSWDLDVSVTVTLLSKAARSKTVRTTSGAAELIVK